jgi:hypothetical protein
MSSHLPRTSLAVPRGNRSPRRGLPRLMVDENRFPDLPRRLDAEMIPDRSLPGPLAIPENGDRVANSVRVAGSNLDRDLVCAGLENVVSPHGPRTEVEVEWHSLRPPSRDLAVVSGRQVDVQKVDVSLGAGMHGSHCPSRAGP